MSIERLYNKTFTVQRMENDGETEWGQQLSNVGSFIGHLQQASIELTESMKSQFSLTHKIWCDVSEDVKTGDVLENNGFKYSIKAITKSDYGKNTHLELLVAKKEDYAI